MSHKISRRGFLAGAAAIGAGSVFGLSGCSNSDSSAKGSKSTTLLPTSAAPGWDAVLEKVNAKMQADIGCTLGAEYYNWSNFGQQSLLKFTAGEKFDSSLQAMWLNMAQLQSSGSLADLTGMVDKYPNLKATIDKVLLDANSWGGKLWGIPQVNAAGRLHHQVVRQDFAEKLGFGEINDYETFERFLYAVKQKQPGVIPFCAANGTAFLLAIPRPTAQFDPASWENPNTIPLSFGGKGVWFFPAKDAATTGSSRLVPFWEVPQVVDTFRRIRKYYQDGIINADAITVDAATVKSQWIAGKYAATWAVTDGLTSTVLTAMQKANPNARLANVLPFKDGFAAKPNQTFQSDNLVVVNAKGGDVERAMKIQDWLSIRENHDLLAYGIEGKDWKPIGEDRIDVLSDYTFPGYALCWRAPLERKPKVMTETEEKVFGWAQKVENFTLDPFASFVPDQRELGPAIAQMTQVITQFGNPLYYGTVDVNSQIDKLKRAADAAGLDKLQQQLESQANAYLAASR
ncbi:DUF3502 domain-containing protein [Micromonospora sp. NPDC047074]|uniref:DUF3502 domain-containing protein n=1 Tax=Micromonospora sp. NPDC047074 TaxID=3154339 RepID=UPI0033C9402E